MEDKYLLIPLKSLGPFQLGDKIDNYIGKYNLTYFKSDTKTNWDLYESEEIDVEIYVENNIIESIACRKMCILDGQNIIKMKIGEFVSIYHEHPDLNQTDTIFIGDEDKPQIVYEFERLGLQIWVNNATIETVFCSILAEDL